MFRLADGHMHHVAAGDVMIKSTRAGAEMHMPVGSKTARETSLNCLRFGIMDAPFT